MKTDNITVLTNSEITIVSGGGLMRIPYLACKAACAVIFGGNARDTCLEACRVLR
jgi:hypothetical protein